jgi:hypothetical protein
MRTDLLRMCVPCLLRVRGSAARCPRCGGPLDGAREGRARLARRPDETRSPIAVALPVFMLSGCGAGLAIAMDGAAAIGVGGLVMLESAAFLAPLGAAVGIFVAVVTRPLFSGKVPARPRLRVHRARRAGRGVVVAGRVEADETLEAPLSGEPCVAFRVTGRAGPGEDRVDDAGAIAFTVVTDGGERVRVLAPPARVRIATRPRAATAAVADLLEPRGLVPGALELAEGHVAPGDRVRVTGTPTQVADPRAPAGYRGDSFLRALVETDGVELEVRRARTRPW